MAKEFVKDNLLINKRIGKGAFGEVFKVEDKITKKLYAVKKIFFDTLNADSKKSIDTELKLLSELSSPFIVRFIDSWHRMEQGGNPYLYIQMELCDDDLANVLSKKSEAFNRYPGLAMNKLEYYLSCELFKDMLAGVQFLHDLAPKPIIHRDLKPANFLVHYEGALVLIKICDFGQATIHDHSSQPHSSRVGSIMYMAPEVKLKGGRKYNTKADVYSLGVIGHELFGYGIGEFENTAKHSETREKFNNISKELDKMIVQKYAVRPSCSELWASSDNWCFPSDLMKQHADSMATLKELKQFVNQFYYKYLVLKLRLE